MEALAGRPRKWLATETRISGSTISDYIRDGIAKTEPAIAIAGALGVSLEWLLTGQGDLERPMVADRQLAYRAEGREGGDVVQVAEIDPRFGLGGAFMDEAAVPEMRSFSRAWLRQITRSAPEELYWARGRGNSMEPTIGDGEVVLIDRSQQTPLDSDLIWAFAWGDVGAIKRLRPMPDGSVKILSDNPSVPPDVAHEGDIHVFGRVVAVVKTL